MLNVGAGRFAEVGGALGVDALPDARGMAVADFDHDGDPDLLVHNYGAAAALYDNRLPSQRWLAVRVRGTRSNRDGVGAEVQAVIGGRRIDRIVGAGHAYASQFSLEQLIGLGGAQGVDDLRVRWPDGRAESFGPHRAGARVTLVEGQGSAVDTEPSSLAPAGAGPPPSRPGADGAETAAPPWRGALAAMAALGLLAAALAWWRQREH